MTTMMIVMNDRGYDDATDDPNVMMMPRWYCADCSGLIYDDDGCDMMWAAGGGGRKGARAGVHDGRVDGGALQARLLRAPAVPGEFVTPLWTQHSSSTRFSVMSTTGISTRAARARVSRDDGQPPIVRVVNRNFFLQDFSKCSDS